jgi:putative ATP-binding cassette transporter
MKNIFLLVDKPARLVYYIFLSILSGLLSFAFMAFVNFLINEMLAGKAQGYNLKHILAFAAIVFFFVVSRRVFAVMIIDFSQQVFWRTRKDIIELMLQADYEKFLRYKTALHASLVRDVNVLTAASMNVIQFSSSVIIILASFVYMAVISLPLFAISFVVLGFGVVIYSQSMKRNEGYLKKSRDLEDGFILNFNSLLHGFKEIHLDPNKGEDIVHSELQVLEAESVANNRKAYVGFLNNQIIGQVLFNCLIGALLLGLTYWLGLSAQVVVNFLFILLFLLSATESAMVMLPSLIQSKVSIDRVVELKQELQQQVRQEEASAVFNNKADFREIVLADLTYTYRPAKEGAGFVVGPINLEINRGEIIFIYGGNGSGKTTFVLSLLGLLKPQEGNILYNGEPLTDAGYASYRKLFGVVFSDFYLFNKLFGLQNVDEERVARYLKLFELEHKVTYQDKAFSSRDLSTGQRKRLALISVLLEDKPLLVLDEWAADQDPYFRKKFYTQIVPMLREEGFTILAVTHDDKYYNCADRVFEMDYGKLKQVWAEDPSLVREG